MIRADAEKARNLVGAGEAYVAVIINHVAEPAPRTLDNVIKYENQLRAVADVRAAESRIRGHLARLGPTTHLALGSGTLSGIRCAVTAWLCGPL